uniref:Allatostatin double C splicing variant a n=1 Tax=Chilo suppressalis TaxID=168631 RepID=A0A0S1U1C0_CHISP|nr:allatostatin double C precursor splicing variant a [Chilo suppressalis]
MMCSPLPLLLVAFSAALAAPANTYEDYPIAVPQKKAALVLDRLLIALQKALHDSPPSYEQMEVDGPRTAPLRGGNDLLQGEGYGERDQDVWLEPDDLHLRVEPLRVHHDDLTGLQRRGQGGAPGVRGRVLRCYFNAITCF